MELLRRHLFFPDDRAGWIPFAAAAGAREARRRHARAVISSGYPHSAHLAAALVRRFSGARWLADFRDGWTQNPAFYQAGNPLMARLQVWGERFVARSADRIVTVSPPITARLGGLRPASLAPPETIWNGFEPGLVRPADSKLEPLVPGCWTMLCTGTFFGRRRPDPFFEALAAVLECDPALRRWLRVRIRPVLGEREQALLDRLGLRGVVETLPAVPFAEAVREQWRADACLLILEDGPGSEIMVSQKVFEYLAARRPVFAMTPPGAAADLLARTGGAVVAPIQSTADSAGALDSFIQSRGGAAGPLPSLEGLSGFSRRNQAGMLAQILDQMTVFG